MRHITNKIYLFLLIGVICMLNSYGCTGNFKYAQYSSKDPELNIVIDHIPNWLYREHRDVQNGYASVLFFENRKDKNYKARITVTIRNDSKTGVQPVTIEAITDDLVTKRLKFKDAKLLSRSKTMFLGLEARDIILSYKAMDKIYSTDAQLIPVKERIVIFKRGDKSCLLRYENTEQEFDKFSKAFNHIAKSLKFKDNK
jgi:N-glycosylase/DNA lyase